ncbi:MAG TPA: glycoside hydrolase family 43 protein [Arachidicoccus sp.]|nr:glycoside hydrolase family 43 protein [Arachidicoccus sp.]
MQQFQLNTQIHLFRKSILQVLGLVVLILSMYGCHGSKQLTSTEIEKKAIALADPTIFPYNGSYYLYGTAGDNRSNAGFPSFYSRDLKHWYSVDFHKSAVDAPNNMALEKGSSFGSKGFWAPQVIAFQNRLLMAYTANEQIAFAYSNNGPEGKFKQKPPFSHLFGTAFKHIDPFIFKDGDQYYLYYVKLNQGNKIYVSKLTFKKVPGRKIKNKMSGPEQLGPVQQETEQLCIEATEPWENTAHTDWPVTEGPTVIKHKGVYYLFYSANDFRNPDYAVGYATATSPMGPWKKSTQCPVLSRQQTGLNGTGHGDVFKDKNKQFYYVFHAHKSNAVVGPRQTWLIPFKFVPAKNSRGTGSLPDLIEMDYGAVHQLKH